MTHTSGGVRESARAAFSVSGPGLQLANTINLVTRDIYGLHRVRPVHEINAIYSAAYGMAVDLSEITPKLNPVSRALDRGQEALALILMSQARFPTIRGDDQLSRALLADTILTTGQDVDELLERARWDERWPGGDEQSRGGQYSPREGGGGSEDPEPNDKGKLSVKRVLELLRKVAPFIGKLSRLNLIARLLDSGELNEGEAEALANDPTFRSAHDKAEPLEELQDRARHSKSSPGYEDHHIVEQRPGNREKFGNRIDDQENIVRIPKYQHTEINRAYSRRNLETGKTLREEMDGKSYEEQYAKGLEIMRNLGILK